MDNSKLPRIFRSNRVETRVRVIYFGVMALAIALLLVVGFYIFRTVSDDYARRLARQYSIEAAANFLAATNTHFMLAQQLAHSTSIARWVANEDDMYLKARAFEVIEGYADYAPHIFLRITIYESLHSHTLGYKFAGNIMSTSVLVYGDLRSQWFFDARDAELSFDLNIQRARSAGEEYGLYVWTNHNIMYNGQFVGVITAGSPFQLVFDAVFGGFDASTRRGYIIDNEGMVRADSAERLQVFVDGWPFPAPASEAADNPNMTEAIIMHLQKIEYGAFQIGTVGSPAIALRGEYRYASIAPIIGTNWSTAVLTGHGNGLDRMYILIITGVAALIIAFVWGTNLLIRKIVIIPLSNLTRSTAETNEKTRLFGLERNDEIGDLARSIELSREKLQHRERLLNAVNQAAELLLTSVGEEDSMAAITEGMGIVGRNLDVDFVHFWKNETIGGEINFILRHSWEREGDDAPVPVRIGMGFQHSSRPELHAFFSPDKTVNNTVTTIPPEHAGLLTDYGIKSAVVLPLHVNDSFFGSICLCDYRRERIFSDEEMDMIRLAGVMLVNAYHRMEQTAEIKVSIDRAEEASLAKSRFLSNMSHEVRTPMNAIIGMAGIARNANTIEKKDECLHKIENASKRLVEIINQILDISKIEADKMEIVLRPFHFMNMVDDIISVVGTEIEQKNLHVSVVVDKTIPRYIVSDETRLAQVLTNLLANAVKFTPEGGSISVKATIADTITGDNKFMQIEVTDNGIGIPPESQAHVFIAFEQADAGMNRRFGGAGLGLAISRRIVELAGGDIWLESEIDKGSNFIFTWPCIPANENAEATEVNKDNITDRYRGHAALVVEDVDINREIVAAMLEGTGLVIDFAENGNKAVEKFNADPGKYNLILMDIHMPEMDGYTATKIIRGLDYPQAASIPIIAMTAHVFREDIQQCLKAGMNNHLAKPLDNIKLYAMLDYYLV